MNDLDPNFGLPLWVSSESYERLRRESAGGPAGEAGFAALPRTAAQDVQAGLACEAGSGANSAAGKVTQSPSVLAMEEEKDMNDATPKVNYWFAIWISLVRYFRAYPPVIQSEQQLELPLPKERRKASGIAASAHAGKHGQYRPAAQGRATGKVTKSPRSYLPKDLERQLPPQPSP
jgi:hypothetical protein